MGIPTAIYEDGMSSADGIDLSSSGKVNFYIDLIAGQMGAMGWSLGTPQKAYTTFTIDLPVVDNGGPFSLIVLWFEGFAFKIYNPGRLEADPTGNVLFGVGPHGENATIVGVPASDGEAQGVIIATLIGKMNSATADFLVKPGTLIEDPGGAFDGVPGNLIIEAKLGGPIYNDKIWFGNILGGGLFNGATKYGGYERVSQAANSDTILRVRMWNNPTNSLAFQTTFMPGPRGNPTSDIANGVLSELVFHGRTNFISLVGRFQWCMFPEVYETYVARNIDDVLIGVSDYWLCAPFVPDEYRFGIKPINYCAFVMIAARDVFSSDSRVSTCISDQFYSGGFGLPDTGACLYLLNSLEVEEGPMRTTAELPLLLSPIIGLSPGRSFFDREHDVAYVLQPLAVVGYAWDMFVTTEYKALNTIAFKYGQKYIAYRTQKAPCEATLWARF